jgi:hypothetical protein
LFLARGVLNPVRRKVFCSPMPWITTTACKSARGASRHSRWRRSRRRVAGLVEGARRARMVAVPMTSSLRRQRAIGPAASGLRRRIARAGRLRLADESDSARLSEAARPFCLGLEAHTANANRKVIYHTTIMNYLGNCASLLFQPQAVVSYPVRIFRCFRYSTAGDTILKSQPHTSYRIYMLQNHMQMSILLKLSGNATQILNVFIVNIRLISMTCTHNLNNSKKDNKLHTQYRQPRMHDGTLPGRRKDYARSIDF